MTKDLENEVALRFEVQQNRLDFSFRFRIDVKVCLGASLRMTTLQVLPTMINGIRKIWIIFDRNSQKTKAGNGSNRTALGARVFQPSQTKVHAKIARKKPIVPTRSVIQIASRSSRDNFFRCSTLTDRSSVRSLLSSWSGGGTRLSLIVIVSDVWTPSAARPHTTYGRFEQERPSSGKY